MILSQVHFICLLLNYKISCEKNLVSRYLYASTKLELKMFKFDLKIMVKILIEMNNLHFNLIYYYRILNIIISTYLPNCDT